jgi:hypothetical protein
MKHCAERVLVMYCAKDKAVLVRDHCRPTTILWWRSFMVGIKGEMVGIKGEAAKEFVSTRGVRSNQSLYGGLNRKPLCC